MIDQGRDRQQIALVEPTVLMWTSTEKKALRRDGNSHSE